MKKIISLVCVIALMFSFAVTVNAADNEVTLTIKEQTADATVLAVNMNTNLKIGGYQFYFNMKPAATAGASFSAKANENITGAKATVKNTSTQKAVIVQFAAGSLDDAFTGNVELATITLTNVTSDFVVERMPESGNAKTEIKSKDEDGANVLSTDDFEYNLSVKVAPYVAPKTEETAPVNPANENAEFKLGDQTWTNVAIYEASFVLADIDTTKEYGIKEGNNKFSSTIAGEGTTTFVLAYYGVTTAPTVEKFWTGK